LSHAPSSSGAREPRIKACEVYVRSVLQAKAKGEGAAAAVPLRFCYGANLTTMCKQKENALSRAPYQSGAAARFIDDLLARGRVAFALSELTRSTQLSPIAARSQLLRLGAGVVRVAPRQQFFLAVAPEHRPAGAPPPSWWLDAYFRWLGRPYYLALQSAAAEYGSSAQAVQVTQVISDRPRRTLSLGRIGVRFYVKRDCRLTPTRPLALAHAPLAVSTPEATALDLVCYASRVGGIGRAAETIAPMLQLFRRAELVRALKADPGTAALQRFGYVLEQLGAPEDLAAAVHARLPPKLKRVLLEAHASSTAKRGPPVSERWSVVANVALGARA
jgi:hypothetical protein